MRSEWYARRTRIEAPAEEVYRWHLRPGAFERLLPPWERTEVQARSSPTLADGVRVTLRVPVGPISVRWEVEHRDFEEGRGFRDVQLRGPFRKWVHTHSMEPDGPDACFLEDRIEFAVPFGAIGRGLGSGMVRRRLERMFDHRHRLTRGDLSRERGSRSLRIAVSGASGLVGSALVPLLTTSGHEVVRLARGEAGEGEARWDPVSGEVDVAALEGVDAVIHLAGENIAAGRWTEGRKRSIRESRVRGTRILADALAGMPDPPATLLCASAVGYYGDRGDEELDETSPPGEGFLASVCREWEEAAAPAARVGIRVVNLRIGVVLTPAGGALAKMLLPFRLGLGGSIGDGRQHVAWIGMEDLIGAIHHTLLTPSIEGPVNLVSPRPVTNGELARTLGRVLRRPALAPLPAAVARLLFGEMADETLLASVRAHPARLTGSGFAFRDPGLEGALRHLLGRLRARSDAEFGGRDGSGGSEAAE